MKRTQEVMGPENNKGGKNPPKKASARQACPRPKLWWAYIVITAAAVCIGLLSLCLAASDYGLAMLMLYLKNPAILLMNLLPVLLLTYLLWYAFNRAWFAIFLSGAAVLAASIGNWYKLKLRDDPFMAIDLKNIGDALNISEHYDITPDWQVICCIVGLLLMTLFALLFVHARHVRHATRVSGAVIVLTALLLTTGAAQTDRVYSASSNTSLINIWSSAAQYVSRGFVYPFLHSISEAILPRPDDYDKDATAELLSSAGDGELSTDEVNIVAVMLEAYNDLSKFEELDIDPTVYDGLHRLQSESCSGELYTSIFAGGTVETEWMFLTGYQHASSYAFRHDLNSYVRWFDRRGYLTEGSHPGNDWFYNRKNVNEYLGFSRYYFHENLYGELYPNFIMTPDSVFMQELTELYAEGTANGTPYFSFNVSYQNHGPYESDSTCEESWITNPGWSDATYNIINNYLSGIAKTDDALEALVDYYRSRSEPVVLVIFGDHNPWLGENNSAWNETGINLNLDTDEGSSNYYCTPYLIWANDAAKAATGSSFTGDGGTISPNFLMNRLFSLLGWQGDAFMQLSDRLLDAGVTVLHNDGWFIENGRRVTELSETAAELYHDYTCAQYYKQKTGE